jgi:hypothetical protein
VKKKLSILLVLFSLIGTQWVSVGTAFARSNPHSTYVHGYTRSNGIHVKGYHRTIANHTTRDNYSHKGNYNPWTHNYGTRTDTPSQFPQFQYLPQTQITS